TATPNPAPAAGDPKSPDDIPLPSKEQRDEFFRRYTAKATEANQVGQLRSELQRVKSEFSTKMAELSKRQIAPGNPDDPLDPASVRSLGETVKLLQERLDLALGAMGKQTEALESFHSQGAASLNEQAALLGLERFQYDTAVSDLVPPALSLQTSVPLPMLNAELQAFAQKVGGLENVNKYLSDPAYKTQVEAAGAKLSDGFIKNLDKFNLIFQLNEEVKAGKYPDPMAAYSHHLITSGKLATALRDSKLAGASAVATEVASNVHATPMLTPGQDGTPAAPGWTKKAALDWLRTHQDIKPGSPDEKTFQEIEKLMNAGQLR
ncbi:MAG TPA: hypothetical protein VK465_15590, partial [Fibrobacteria bacterium]|nr:hypothetical protein [Fibrobacteria bacterium]